MEIIKTQTDGTITLKISGKLSAATSEEAEAALSAALEETDKLVIDIEGLTYLASAGLRILVSAQKKLKEKNGSLVILKPQDSVREVFELTGLDDVFEIQ